MSTPDRETPPPAAASERSPGGTPRVLTLVFTDLADSTLLKNRLGDHAAATVIDRHHELVRRLLDECGGREVDAAGDGFFLTFETPSAGALFALLLENAHHADPDLPAVRVGIHLGEVTERPAPQGSSKPLLVEGLAVDLAARLQGLARPGQVLLSRGAFDSARQRLRGTDLALEVEWRAHGPYLLKGIDEPVEIGEIALAGRSSLDAPADSDKARRAVAAGDEVTLGWRPAIGLLIPGREHWRLSEQLGTGAIGEVWLAAHDKTHARRVFKFCFEAARLRGLKREVALLRILRERLGERRDIAQVIDWHFDRPPFFLETAYTDAGDLVEWARRRGGIGQVPLAARVEIAAQTADALAAAHQAGVLHKDLKPSNLLISEEEGRPRVCLTDFGIGLMTSSDALSSVGVTVAGLTETLLSSSSSSTGAGTRLYMAPEVLEGRPADERSDLYGLGVVLYQMVIGDLGRALAPGWERDVADPELRSDIAACVDGDPARRLANAADLATRLRAADERRGVRERRERERKARERRAALRRWLVIGVGAVVALALIGTVVWRQQAALRAARDRAERVRWAREEALPEIERLASTGELEAAFALALEAEQAIPGDPVLDDRFDQIAVTGSIITEPPGATVSVRPYRAGAEAWRVLGETPLARVRLPRGVYRWKLEKDGFETAELLRRPPDDFASAAAYSVPLRIELAPSGSLPQGMVRVGAGSWPVWLAGFPNAFVELDAFDIDRFEVTNRAFREFVDQDGYTEPELWADGPDPAARAAFRDRTGRPGPATWELGGYPEGEGDLPVGGVSWYEAAAYCRFRGKTLPTAYHWARAALSPNELLNPVANAIIPSSNLSGTAPAAVGSFPSLTAWGAYDMAGNVSEWGANATLDGDRRYVLGGAWNAPGYLFYEPEKRAPSTREAGIGFRCMRLDDGAAVPEQLAAPVGGERRGPRDLRPVSDEVFATFLAMRSYTGGPLDPRVEERDTSPEHWTVETVSFTAAYGDERVPAYLLLPKNGTPPYQTVVYWPAGGTNVQSSRDDLREATNLMLRFLVQSGRAALYPVLYGTFDRRPAAPDPDQGTKQIADVERALDYLETRDDIDAQRLGYAGISFGSNMAPYLARPGFERLRAMVLVAGGLMSLPLPPHRDQVNFAPRMKTPVLMINGRYDSSHPLETSVEPLFRLFGAPEEDKKLLLLDSGHVPQPTLLWIQEALEWYDRYLGPVGTGTG